MNSGLLRNLVQLQSPGSPASGVGGQITETFSTYASVWAQVRGLTGREMLQAQQVHAEVNYEVVIRYRSDVGPKHRIKTADNRTLEIEASVDPDGRRAFLRLLCTELADAAAE